MKKNKKIFSLLIIIILFLCFNKKVFASETADWEFYPLGINYLSNDNFTFTRGSQQNQGTISTINYIKVKSSTKYYLYFYCYQEGCFTSATITGYNENKTSLGSISTSFSSDKTVITFSTGSNCKYITMSIGVEEEYGNDLGLDDIESNYVLADHEVDIVGISDSDILYKGPDIDYSPVLSGVDGHYITNVNNPISLQSILSGVKAYDDNDGDLTDSIIVSSDNYSSNRYKVGVWKIVLSVSDSANNTTTFTIYVTVVDTEDPKITGTTSFKVKTTDNYSVSSFFDDIAIVDNYDGNISDEIVVVNDGYTKNKNKAGTYTVTCYVEDSSNNRLDFSFTVVVEYVDEKAPVFSGKFTYEVNKTDVLSISTILANVTATDDLDGDVTKKITIKNDYYSKAPSRVGTFKIILSVTDNAGNEALQEITITVKDNIPPVFYVDTKVITIDLKDNTLTVNDLVDTLIKTESLKENVSYYVTYDNYTENKNIPGEYKVVLEVEGMPVALSVNVLEHKEEKKTFFEKVSDFFVKIFSIIKSFFKRIF